MIGQRVRDVTFEIEKLDVLKAIVENVEIFKDINLYEARAFLLGISKPTKDKMKFNTLELVYRRIYEAYLEILNALWKKVRIPLDDFIVVEHTMKKKVDTLIHEEFVLRHPKNNYFVNVKVYITLHSQNYKLDYEIHVSGM